MNENSVPQPSSGKDHLDGTSLPPETWSNLTWDNMASVTISGPKSLWDKEYLDCTQPEDAPEPSNQEWLECWKSWKGENDPYPPHSFEEDPIFAHLRKAKDTGSTHLFTQEAGADQFEIDAKDTTGRTRLSFAAEMGDLATAQLLLEKAQTWE